MKRYICLILAGSLLLSLAGCGGDGGAAAVSPAPPVESVSTAQGGAVESPAVPPELTENSAVTSAPAESAAAVINAAPEETVPASQVPDSATPAATAAMPQVSEAAPATPVAESAAPAASETPVEDEDAVPIPAFTTTDLAGNTVTNDIFSGKDLTVVNVWATYCGPCISEMPELGAWAKELPENVQLIGIVGDLASGDTGETYELALAILAQAGAEFPCLTVSDDLLWLLYSISGVPTTFFVDGKGNIVGNAVLGAYVERYKAQVEELLHGA